jgi:hypothetical protein
VRNRHYQLVFVFLTKLVVNGKCISLRFELISFVFLLLRFGLILQDKSYCVGDETQTM